MPTPHNGIGYPPPDPRPAGAAPRPGGPAPRRPHAAGPAPEAGRHRRRRLGRHQRPALLTALAVVTLLLSSGTAISLTGEAPTGHTPPGPESAALGGAPATTSAGAADATGRAAAPTPTPTAQPAPQPERQPPRQAADQPQDELTDQLGAMESEVVDLTNRQRRAAECDEVSVDLTVDVRLREAARGHSRDMAANDYFDHNSLDGRSPFDRMRDAGYPDPAGENIAYGYRTPADVMAGWMDSDGHRRNLLSCGHRTIGVGLAYNSDGRPYWTQVFGR